MALNYSPHYLLRLGGAFGPERWSFGLRLEIGGIGFQDETSQAVVETVENHARTLFNALRTYMHPAVNWDWLSCNHIGSDGKYTSSVSHETFVTPVVGTGTSNNWKGPDASLAVSLLTAQKRGYASKGRIYLPTGCLQLTETNGPDYGDVSPSMRNLIGPAVAIFIGEINDLGTDLATNNPQLVGRVPRVCIFSPGTGKKQDMTKPGAYHDVTAVRVGAQLDTQRRRLNKQADLWDQTATTVQVNA